MIFFSKELLRSIPATIFFLNITACILCVLQILSIYRALSPSISLIPPENSIHPTRCPPENLMFSVTGKYTVDSLMLLRFMLSNEHSGENGYK